MGSPIGDLIISGLIFNYIFHLREPILSQYIEKENLYMNGFKSFKCTFPFSGPVHIKFF